MTLFISRHPGARAWAATIPQPIDRFLEQLDPATVQPGDVVLGTLPVHLAAAVCARGARYFHLSLDLTRAQRGGELTPEAMQSSGARLEEYRITRAEPVSRA